MRKTQLLLKRYWKYILAFLLSFIALCVLSIWFLTVYTPSTYHVTLQEDGFFPKDLTINEGDTVVFNTKLNQPFWIASDEHPSHLSFPEFDAKKPLDSDNTWSFTFAKSGTYGFHDHIHSSYTGEIIVRTSDDGSEDTKPGPTFASCLETENISLKVECWTTFIEEYIHEHGLAKTFEIFTEIYRSDPDFVAVGCHGAVHKIGEVAYELYKSGEDIEFTADTTACGYGFYHGFLGKLAYENPDINDAVKFCETLKNASEKNGDEIYVTCFHGIGHGTIEESPLPEYFWGNTNALLDPALKLCGTLPEAFQQRECADGAFNGFGRFMIANEYGFTYDTSNPLGWCEAFKDTRINYVSCIFEMSQHFAVSIVYDNTELKNILPFIEGLDPEAQAIVIENAVGGLMQKDVVRTDNSDYFIQCSIFKTHELEFACLHGVVGGFFAHGEPGNEAPKAIDFCAAEEATDDQRISCNKLLVAYRGTDQDQR